MKTPKRTYTTNFLEWGDEFCHRLSSGQQRAYARWKRKNRIARFKATIARLRAENAHLKKELQNEINFRFSALKALLETRKELAELRKERS